MITALANSRLTAKPPPLARAHILAGLAKSRHIGVSVAPPAQQSVGHHP